MHGPTCIFRANLTPFSRKDYVYTHSFYAVIAWVADWGRGAFKTPFSSDGGVQNPFSSDGGFQNPFSSKKATTVSSFRLVNFEVCDAKAAPAEILRTLPEGTLKASQAAAAAATSGGGAPNPARLHIFLRGQLLPSRPGAAKAET